MKIKSWQVLSFKPWHDDSYVADIQFVCRRGILDWVLGRPAETFVRAFCGQGDGWTPLGWGAMDGISTLFGQITDELEKEYAWAERMQVLAPDLSNEPIGIRPREIFRTGH